MGVCLFGWVYILVNLFESDGRFVQWDIPGWRRSVERATEEYKSRRAWSSPLQGEERKGAAEYRTDCGENG